MNKKYITLLGTPLSQSFSARMQNKAYDEMGIDMEYYYTETDQDSLEAEVMKIRAGLDGELKREFRGFAVTKPCKVEVLKYLDELDPVCERIGACNTVDISEDGKLKGYNTDALGFLKSIREEGGIDVENSSFFIIGYGGAGRAVCGVLEANNAKKVEYCDKGGAYEKALEADVVINASGVGMGKTMGESPIPDDLRKIILQSAKPDTLFYDCCYNPLETQFLKDAREAGFRTLNGIGMLLYQGVAQIELWTGQDAPVETMRQEILDILKEKEA